MGNPLPPKTLIGTIGELLVQLRLLEYDVQAAPPVKDSGNDLIAIRGLAVKFLQVKSTVGNKFNLSNLPKIYHLIFLVQLVQEDGQFALDNSKIFVLKKEENKNKSSISVGKLKGRELTNKIVGQIWKKVL